MIAELFIGRPAIDHWYYLDYKQTYKFSLPLAEMVYVKDHKKHLLMGPVLAKHELELSEEPVLPESIREELGEGRTDNILGNLAAEPSKDEMTLVNEDVAGEDEEESRLDADETNLKQPSDDEDGSQGEDEDFVK